MEHLSGQGYQICRAQQYCRQRQRHPGKNERLPAKLPEKETSFTPWSELLGEEPVEEEIIAEEVEQQQEPQYQTTVTIQADWMVYDVDLETIKAKGNLKIITAEDQLYAKEGTLQLTDETGQFEQATIIRNEDSLHLEGQKIAKTGFKTYRIIDGWAITCKVEEGETPPWSFAASDVKIEQGGYAVMKHARFKIGNIPVFYSPWMAIPIDNTRQTGFLFPEFSSSNVSGFSLNLPFFTIYLIRRISPSSRKFTLTVASCPGQNFVM
jgi:LPS-assembly protein